MFALKIIMFNLKTYILRCIPMCFCLSGTVLSLFKVFNSSNMRFMHSNQFKRLMFQDELEKQ